MSEANPDRSVGMNRAVVYRQYARFGSVKTGLNYQQPDIDISIEPCFNSLR